MEKQLSIIIPHYNSLQLLKRLLASIPAKEEIQVIAVDDKSNIDAKEWEVLTREFSYVELYWNETDEKGAGVCRNIGLEHAVGKWLLFADADDYFVEGFYEKVEEYFVTDSDIVFFTSTSVYEENGKMADRHLFSEERIYNFLARPNRRNELLLRYEYDGPCAKLIRRSIVENNDIRFQEVMYSNDVIFSAKTAYYAENITADLNIIYVITKSTQSLTATIKPESTMTRLQVFIDKILFLKQNLTKEDFSLLNQNGMGWLLKLLKNHSGSDMFRYCIRLFRTNKVPLLNYRLFTFRYWYERRENRKCVEIMKKNREKL